MRPAAIIAILLALLVLFAGCEEVGEGESVFGTTRTTPPVHSTLPTTVVPGTTGPLVEWTPVPTGTTVRPPVITTTTVAPLVLIDEKNLAFVYNGTIYKYTLEKAPLVIEWTLTVPDVTTKKVVTNPVTGADETVTSTYPDPYAQFEVTVRDFTSGRIFAQDGYGGQYAVTPTKKIRVLYPGTYLIEFWGDRVQAHVEVYAPG